MNYYEVVRDDVVLLRTHDYMAAKELYDWFSTYMSRFSYRLVTRTV